MMFIDRDYIEHSCIKYYVCISLFLPSAKTKKNCIFFLINQCITIANYLKKFQHKKKKNREEVFKIVKRCQTFAYFFFRNV